MRKPNQKATIILKTYVVICLVGIVTLLGGCQSFKMPEMPDFSKFSLPFSKTAAPQDIAPLQATPDTPSLKCTIIDGSVRFSRGWYDLHPAAFTVLENVTQNIDIYNKNNDEKITLTAQHVTGSQKLVLCPADISSPDSAACRTLYALEDDFNIGIQRTLDITNTIRGGHIACHLYQNDIPAVSMPMSDKQ